MIKGSLDNHADSSYTFTLLDWSVSVQDLLQTRLHIHLLRVPCPFITPEVDAMSKVHHKENRNADTVQVSSGS